MGRLGLQQSANLISMQQEHTKEKNAMIQNGNADDHDDNAGDDDDDDDNAGDDDDDDDDDDDNDDVQGAAIVGSGHWSVPAAGRSKNI